MPPPARRDRGRDDPVPPGQRLLDPLPAPALNRATRRRRRSRRGCSPARQFLVPLLKPLDEGAILVPAGFGPPCRSSSPTRTSSSPPAAAAARRGSRPARSHGRDRRPARGSDGGLRACVFDAYGTLFDVHSAVAWLRPRLGARADPALPAVARQAARVHLAPFADGPPCRLLAGHRGPPGLALARRRRPGAARAADAGLPRARRLPRGARGPAPAARGGSGPRSSPTARPRCCGAAPRAPGSPACSTRCSRSRTSGSSSRTPRSIGWRSSGWASRPARSRSSRRTPGTSTAPPASACARSGSTAGAPRERLPGGPEHELPDLSGLPELLGV